MLSLKLLLLLAPLPASLQQTCDLMMMGKVNPVTDLIDSALTKLGFCARGPGWSESGRLHLTSSSQGNRRVQGEIFNQVWWKSLVKRPDCVTKLAIFVNGIELGWLTDPKEPLNFLSSIPTTQITLRLFYKDPIPMFPDKCLELRIHFEVAVTESEPRNNFERRQDRVGADFRFPQDGGRADTAAITCFLQDQELQLKISIHDKRKARQESSFQEMRETGQTSGTRLKIPTEDQVTAGKTRVLISRHVPIFNLHPEISSILQKVTTQK